MGFDPYFQEIPWDIITDDNGAVIGEVYTILPEAPPRKRQRKWGTTSEMKRRFRDGQYTCTKSSG
ncbi:hypothetical protein D3C71_1732180 [compost metagenome]